MRGLKKPASPFLISLPLKGERSPAHKRGHGVAQLVTSTGRNPM